MSEEYSDRIMEAEKREKLGTRESRRTRRAGYTPAVLYGAGSNQNIKILTHFLEKFYHPNKKHRILTLDIKGDKKRNVLVHDVKYDPIFKKVIHVDFYEVTKGQILTTEIPIKFEGVPVGVKTGGIMEQFMHYLHISCLPKDIPEEIVVDVSNLNVGDSIHVSDLEVPSEAKVLNNSEQAVVSIVQSRLTKVTEEGEEGAAAEESGAAAESATEESKE